MIIVRMSGGLGNQMFQYAFYRQLCALGRTVEIDDFTEYEHQELTGVVRELSLTEAFGISYPRTTKEQIEELTDAKSGISAKLHRKLAGRHSLELHDEDFIYDDRFLTLQDGYFTGCFQSERYFAAAKDDVKKAFTFREELFENNSELKALREEIRESNSVAIHLRFGDYLDKTETYGNLATDAYYDAAIRKLLTIEDKALLHFYVFSNDVARATDWIAQRENLESFTLVQGADEAHGYLDMALMKEAKHHIIANSSFSWWGAYLSERGGQTITPALWIHMPDGSEIRRTDIYTKDMIRINAAGHEVTEQPLVSVIVAAYQIERYIERAMKSLTNQTYANLQIIAVDDGSKDATGAILDKIASEDARITVVHKENGGLSDARNAGLALVQGDYICYLDGDDYADSTMIAKMVQAALLSAAEVTVIGYAQVADAQNADAKVADAQATDATSEHTHDSSESSVSKTSHISLNDAISDTIYMNRDRALRVYLSGDETTIIYNSVWSKMFLASHVRDLTFPVGRNSEDILYTTKALARAKAVAYVKEPLYYYVTDRAGSIMNEGLGERRLKDELPFWKEQIAYFKELGEDDYADMAAFYYYRRLLFYDVEFRNQKDMRRYAETIERSMVEDEATIRRVYELPYASRGDRARMKTFLKNPKGYYQYANRYEQTVVRLRNAMAGK